MPQQETCTEVFAFKKQQTSFPRLLLLAFHTRLVCQLDLSWRRDLKSLQADCKAHAVAAVY